MIYKQGTNICEADSTLRTRVSDSRDVLDCVARPPQGHGHPESDNCPPRRPRPQTGQTGILQLQTDKSEYKNEYNLRSFVPWLVLLSCVLKYIVLSCK